MRFLGKLKWWLYFRFKLWKYRLYMREHPWFGNGMPNLDAFMLFCQLDYMGHDLVAEMTEKYIGLHGSRRGCDFLTFLREEGIEIVGDHVRQG